MYYVINIINMLEFKGVCIIVYVSVCMYQCVSVISVCPLSVCVRVCVYVQFVLYDYNTHTGMLIMN